MVLKIKISFNGDVRRLPAIPRDFSSLQLEAFKSHEIAVPDRVNLVLKFIDDEGDFITLSSTRDFDEALSLAREEQRKSLKLFIFDKNQVAAEHQLAARVNSGATYVSESVATASVAPSIAGSSAAPLASLAYRQPVAAVPVAPPTPTVAAAVPPTPVTPVKATPEETPKPKEETATKKEETSNDKEGAKPAHGRRHHIRRQILDFIRDAKVQSDLPDAVLVWFSTLRGELNAAAQHTEQAAKDTTEGAKAAIVKAFNTVFDTFESIGSNELIKKARRHVERLAERAAMLVPLIVSFDENQIVVHVKKILEVINNCTKEDGEFSCAAFKEHIMGALPTNFMSSMMPMAGMFMPMMFGGGMGGGMFGGPQGSGEGVPPSPFGGMFGGMGGGPFGGGASFFDFFGGNDEEDEDDDEDDTPKKETETDSKTGDEDHHGHHGRRHGHGGGRWGGRCGGRRHGHGGGRWGGRRHGHHHHHGHHHGHHGHGGWWRRQQQQQQANANADNNGNNGMPDFSQMGPFGAMLANMMGGAAAGQQQQQGQNPFAAMFGGANANGNGNGEFDQREFRRMMHRMMHGGGMGGGMNGGMGGGVQMFGPGIHMFPPAGGRRGFNGMNGGRCGGGRGMRGGMRGQRGPYNAEVTRQDKKMITKANASFTVTIKNTGEQAWPEGSRIVYTRHDRVGPMELDLPVAQPGESVDVIIPLTVDEIEVGERYHSVYRMKLPMDVRPPRKFGDAIHIRVKVVDKLDEAEPKKVEETATEPKATAPPAFSALSPPLEPTREPELDKDDEDEYASLLNEAAKEQDQKPAAVEKEQAGDSAKEHADKLKLLAGMGFGQEDLNLWVLKENDGNVQKAALQLVQLYKN